jgi:uncharacterized membrane protein YgcG
MRKIAYVLVLLVSMSGLAMAQEEWVDYQNIEDGFKLNFPGQPKVTPLTWTSWHEFKYPGRVYTVDKGKEHYSMTVIDYSSAEQQGLAKVKTCPPGAEPCLGSDLAGIGYWKHDVRGAINNAVFRMMTRPNEKLTDYVWAQEDLVEGDQLALTNTVDGSRTFGFVAMHKMKLYIMEATVPKGYPQPELFIISLGWVDKDGKGIRYQSIYNNEFMEIEHVPTPSYGGGGGGGRGGAGRQGGAGGGGRRGGGADAPQQ